VLTSDERPLIDVHVVSHRAHIPTLSIEMDPLHMRAHVAPLFSHPAAQYGRTRNCRVCIRRTTTDPCIIERGDISICRAAGLDAVIYGVELSVRSSATSNRVPKLDAVV
jgi:hypothetical protein